MNFLQRIFIGFIFLLYTPIHADKSVGFNVGIMASKSTLGISYLNGQNEVNVGLKNRPAYMFRSSGMYFQPGLTFNRYLGRSGFYGSLTYAPIYAKMKHWDYLSGDLAYSIQEPIVGDDYWIKEGWNSGEIFFGLGKSFQFTHWGIHFDGNLISPVTSQLGQTWFYQVGAGLSYRFNLD
jgi:hypothetical protein